MEQLQQLVKGVSPLRAPSGRAKDLVGKEFVARGTAFTEIFALFTQARRRSQWQDTRHFMMGVHKKH